MNMKKVASVAMATALTASLAVSASAASVGHAHGECSLWNELVNRYGHPAGAVTVFQFDRGYMGEWSKIARTVSRYTRLTLPKGVREGFTDCRDAITVEELDGMGLGNLTVFKQRELTGVQAGATVDVRLWTCGPKNSVVVLFREAGQDAWTVLAQGENGSKDVQATLPGDGAIAVCMTW